MGFHLRGGRLQSGAVAQADGGADMSVPAGCKLVGRWRIVEHAAIVIGAEGRGEIGFGTTQATLDIEYSQLSFGFAWLGFDGGDEISGEEPPNFSMTAASGSDSSTTATTPSSMRSESFFQQPARGHFCLAEIETFLSCGDMT